MAKAKRKVKSVVRKGKKRWFTAIAPELFNKQELGEVAAFEPKNLPGRVLDMNLMMITRSPRDQSKKIIFEIVDTKVRINPITKPNIKFCF